MYTDQLVLEDQTLKDNLRRMMSSDEYQYVDNVIGAFELENIERCVNATASEAEIRAAQGAVNVLRDLKMFLVAQASDVNEEEEYVE